MAQAMYQQQAQQGQPNPNMGGSQNAGSTGSGKSDDDVVDADFKEKK